MPDLPLPDPLLPDLPEDDESHEPHELEEQGFPQSPLEDEDPPLLPDVPLPLLPDLPLPEPLFPLLPEEDESSDLPHPQSGEEDDDDDHPPETSCVEAEAAIRNRETFILY